MAPPMIAKRPKMTPTAPHTRMSAPPMGRRAASRPPSAKTIPQTMSAMMPALINRRPATMGIAVRCAGADVGGGAVPAAGRYGSAAACCAGGGYGGDGGYWTGGPYWAGGGYWEGGAYIGGGCAWGAGCGIMGTGIGVPQLWQNFAPSTTSLPHDVQNCTFPLAGGTPSSMDNTFHASSRVSYSRMRAHIDFLRERFDVTRLARRPAMGGPASGSRLG